MRAVLTWNSPRCAGTSRLITAGTCARPSPSALNASRIVSTATRGVTPRRSSSSEIVGMFTGLLTGVQEFRRSCFERFVASWSPDLLISCEKDKQPLRNVGNGVDLHQEAVAGQPGDFD